MALRSMASMKGITCSIGNICTKGRAACGRPPFVGVSQDAAKNPLHDACHAAKIHVLKSSMRSRRSYGLSLLYQRDYLCALPPSLDLIHFSGPGLFGSTLFTFQPSFLSPFDQATNL